MSDLIQENIDVRGDFDPDVLPDEVAIIPLRDTIVFPNTLYPILVGRESTLAAINDSLTGGKYVLLVAQKDPLVEEPGFGDIYQTGTLAHISQVLRLPNNLVKVLVSGIVPANIASVVSEMPYMKVTIETWPLDESKVTNRLQALIRRSREKFERYVMINQELPQEILLGIDSIDNPSQLLYFMASYLELDIAQKQNLLEQPNIEARFKNLLTYLTSEIELLAVSTEINEKVQDEIQESQRKFYIQEQIKALQDELDEGEFADPELNKIRDAIESMDMPEHAREKAMEELDKLRKTPAMSPEYSVARNYLDWMISIPWGTYSEDRLTIKAVEEELENDHFGLEKPKDRILEHIAVLNLVKNIKGQILCFVGPPGTGKTSLAKSIASALNRQMVRIALGGISDEAEIRGHRRTYIGSMPGRIIQSMKRAGTMNPVIILDEIDKVTHDFRGDPSSAILEVLDPEQNHTFNDHYLDIDFDLSQVMFIATANVASNIQPALLDRMEIINLPGYLEHDKLEIAKRHLIPKNIRSHGLLPSRVKFKDEAILRMIRKYTAEAGVRKLEQQITSVCRKIAKMMVLAKERGESVKSVTVNEKKLRELLGVEKYRDRALDKRHKIGSVNGLAWTSTGGTILQIDVAGMHGKGKFQLTGQLGDVMKESAMAALTYIRANADSFGLPEDYFEKNELHIHIPEGAIPKDGPSAGLAMAVAMLSLITNRKVRYDVAMTGEITLRGEIFAIGGLNEKLLAAKRNQIAKVLIPSDNEQDLDDIPEKVKAGLKILPISTIDEAIPHVFVD